MKKSMMFLIIFSFLSKFLGLFRDMFLASKFGATFISDAFIISTSIPSILMASFASAVLTNYIPVLSKIDSNNEDQESFNSTLITLIVIFVTLGIGLFLAFDDYILRLFAIGFKGEAFDTLKSFSNLSIFATYFIILAELFNGYAQYNGNFKGAGFTGIIMNVFTIIGIMLSGTKNTNILILFFLIGNFANMLLIYFFAKQSGLKYKPTFSYKNKYFKQIFILAIPLLLNSAIWDINGIIDKSLVSSVGEGYVSALNYSNKISSIVSGIFSASLATVIYPKISQLFSTNKFEGFRELINKSMKLTSLVIIPVTIFMIGNSKPIIEILFGSKFDINALNVTSISLKIYSIGLLCECYKIIMYKVFYAQQNTKTPSYNAVFSITLNIIMNLLFIKPFGYIGVVSATLISSTLTTFLLIRSAKNVFKKHDILQVIKISLYSMIIAFCCFIIGNFIVGVVNTNIFLSLLIQGCIFVFLYLIVTRKKIMSNLP